MLVIDAFCGAGGWSAGAVAAGCTPVLGIDCDEKPLKLWATNCAPAGRAICATLGSAHDTVDWPAPAPDVHLHMSPPCTSLSKARAGSATAASVADALDAVRWCVQLVLARGYSSWSLENVATPAVVACVKELARQHPDRVAHLTLDAADYGVGSNRVRLIASTPAVIRALKEMPVQRVSVAEALAAAGGQRQRAQGPQRGLAAGVDLITTCLVAGYPHTRVPGGHHHAAARRREGTKARTKQML